MRKHQNHLPTKRGKKVITVLRDGTRFEDVFIESKNKTVIFKYKRRVNKSEIRYCKYSR